MKDQKGNLIIIRGESSVKRKKATENKRKVIATLCIYDIYPSLYAQLLLIHTLFRAVMLDKVAENTELANIDPLLLWKILG